MPLLTVNSSYEKLYGMDEKDYFTSQNLTIELLEDGIVQFKMEKNLTTEMYDYIQYSIDGLIWETAKNVDNQEVILSTPKLHKGYKIQWRGIGKQLASGNGTDVFICNSKFNVYGNIMSLLHGKDFIDKQQMITNAGARIFACLFQNTKVVSAEDLILPLKNLSLTTNRIYYQMFGYCKELIKAPELPATTLGNGSYWGMFSQCTKLTDMPKLPATTLGQHCYREMFINCESLKNMQEIVATTNVNYACRRMFYNCKSITTIPKINFTNAATESCMEMFYGCWSLTDASSLTINSVSGSNACSLMFSNCRSLINGPLLAAKTLANSCYKQMFYACDTLNNVKMYATNISATNCLSAWLPVSRNYGTLILDWAVKGRISRGSNGIPYYWGVHYDNVSLEPPTPEVGIGFSYRSGTVIKEGQSPLEIVFDDDTVDCLGVKFTLDGTDPKLSDLETYNGKFNITDETTIRAIPFNCYDGVYAFGAEIEGTFDYQSLPEPEVPTATVIFDPEEGDIVKGNRVSLRLSGGVATGIKYNLNSSQDVNQYSSNYSSPIAINQDTIIKATAYNSTSNGYKTKYALGSQSEAEYTCINPPTPVEPLLYCWVDDFPMDDYDGYTREEIMEEEMYDPRGFGANEFHYKGSTIEYDGDTYYLWRNWDFDNGEYTDFWLLTTTDDEDALYDESIVGNNGSDTDFTLGYALLFGDTVPDSEDVDQIYEDFTGFEGQKLLNITDSLQDLHY